MIIETVIIAGAAVIIASLGFADRVMKRQTQQDKPVSGNIEKQKEILERQRTVWLKVAQAPCTTPERQGYLDKAAEIDKQLLKLAQEEENR